MKGKTKRVDEVPLIQLIKGLEKKKEVEGIKGEIKTKVEIKTDINVYEVANKIVPAKTSFCEQITALFSKLPSKIVDWEKEWHKHLEREYNG